MLEVSHHGVSPAKAGVQAWPHGPYKDIEAVLIDWIPAFAGTTKQHCA
jgi:hypothetical protein